MDQIRGLLQQYIGASADEAPSNVEDHFDQAAQAAPQSDLADGIASAFRSNQTPPFGQIVSQIFQQSNGNQKAGILNTILSHVNPGMISQALGGGGLAGLAGMLGGGQDQVTPEQADQVPADSVGQVAAQAENQSPSIVDEISGFCSQHPDLVKSVGGGAMAMVLSALGQKNQ